jgi:hypothetical protein
VTPLWFNQGAVADITAPQWDAAEFLEGDEFDREWRLCSVPREFFADVAKPTYSEFISDSARRAGTDFSKEMERVSDVMSWITGSGGIRKALSKRPPVILWTAGGVKVLDGSHRIAIAYHLPDQGKLIAALTCLVALGESAEG